MQNLGSIQSVCACMAALMQGGLGSPGSSAQVSEGQAALDLALLSPNGKAEHQAADKSDSAEEQPEKESEPAATLAADSQPVLLPLRVSLGVLQAQNASPAGVSCAMQRSRTQMGAAAQCWSSQSLSCVV